MYDSLLKNLTLVNSEDPYLIKNAWIAISEDEIKAIGDDKKKLPEAKKTQDLKGQVVIPGLVNCHTHAAMTAFRGLADDLPLKTWLKKYIWPRERKELSPDFVKKWVKLACQEMKSGGITCFGDMYFFQKYAASVVVQEGMRFVAGDAVIKFLKNCFEMIEEFTQSSWHPLVDCAVMAHSTYAVSEKSLLKAKALAKKYKKQFVVHAGETKKDAGDVKLLSKLGLLDANTVLVHAVWLDEKDIKTLARTKTKVVHCPQSNMKLASGISPVAKMIKSGITVGLGTDGAASNNTLDMWREMKTASLLQKVNLMDPEAMPAKKVFQMATIDGAKVLGKENEIGSLKPGKKADLVVIDFNKPHLEPVYNYFSHLVYAVEAGDVEATMVGGEWVYEKASK